MPLNSDGECRENIPLARRKTAATHSHKSCYTVFVFQMHRYELRTTLLFLFVIASWDLASSRCLFFCSGVSELLPVRYHTNCKICGMQPDRTDHSWLNLSPSNPPPPRKRLSLCSASCSTHCCPWMAFSPWIILKLCLTFACCGGQTVQTEGCGWIFDV